MITPGRCAVSDCSSSIPHERAFCARHWRRLSHTQRAEVYSSYRSFLRGARSVSKHFAVLERVARELVQPSLELGGGR